MTFSRHMPEQEKNRINSLMKEAFIPGLSIASITEGKLDWEESFGVPTAESKDSLNSDNVFWACSLSKPLFAYLIFKLIEDKSLPEDFINAPLTKFLKYNERFSKSISDDDRNQLTARMVLSHTTGLPNWNKEGTGIGPLALAFKPGTQFSYSGEGFLYLQKVIEQETGKTLEKLAKEKIFDPLEMHHSHFTRPEIDNEKVVVNHDEKGNPQQPLPFKFGDNDNLNNNSNAAASLHTTASDYARFIMACLNDENFIKMALTTPKIHLATDQKALNKGVAVETLDSLGWGVGFGLQQTENGNIAFHWGDGPCAKSFMAMNLQNHSGLVYFANSENGLMLAPKLITTAIGNLQPCLDWLYKREDVFRFDSPFHHAIKAEKASNFELAISLLTESHKEQPENTKIEFKIEWLKHLDYKKSHPEKIDVSTLKDIVGDYGPVQISLIKDDLQITQGGKTYNLITINKDTFLDPNGVILKFEKDGNHNSILISHFPHGKFPPLSRLEQLSPRHQEIPSKRGKVIGPPPDLYDANKEKALNKQNETESQVLSVSGQSEGCQQSLDQRSSTAPTKSPFKNLSGTPRLTKE